MSIPFTWVYLIHDEFTDYWKIGKSDNPERRLEELRRPMGTILAAPTESYVLHEAWLAPEATEGQLHEIYAKWRVRGEWFRLQRKEQVREIEGILQAHDRWFAGIPLMRQRYERYIEYTIEYTRQIRELEKERDSLLRQRTYLAAKKYSEPVEKEFVN